LCSNTAFTWLKTTKFPLPSLHFVGIAVLFLGALSAFAQADQARAKKIAGGSCFLCHGEQGEHASEVYPRLAGQDAEYVAKQLAAFQSGQRKSSTMAPMVAKLKPDEMLALGSHHEQMSLPRKEAKDPQLAAMGRCAHHNGNKLSGVPACASCHGAVAEG
jgi:cytochrome c553